MLKATCPSPIFGFRWRGELRWRVSSILLYTGHFFKKLLIQGVPWGWILSPYWFATYVDTLSVTLNNARVGYHINNCCANHMLYAADLCVIAPSTRGLQYLLDTYSKDVSKMISYITLQNHHVWLSNHPDFIWNVPMFISTTTNLTMFGMSYI